MTPARTRSRKRNCSLAKQQKTSIHMNRCFLLFARVRRTGDGSNLVSAEIWYDYIDKCLNYCTFGYMKKTLISFVIAIVLVPSISFAATPVTVDAFEAQRIQLMEQIIVLLKARIEYLIAILGQKQTVLSVATPTQQLSSVATTTTPVIKKKRSGGGGGGGGSSSSASRERDAACILSLILKDAPLETKVMYLNSMDQPTYVWWGLNTTEEVYAYVVGWLRNYEATGAIYYQHNPDYTYPYAISHVPVLESRLTEYYKNKQLCGVEPAPYTFTPYVAATPTPAFGEVTIATSANDPDATTFELDDDAKSSWMTVFAFSMDTGSSTRGIMINKIPVTIDVSGNDFGSLVDDLAIVIDDEEYDDWDFVTGDETSSSVVVEFNIGGHTIDIGDTADVGLQVVFNALTTEGATIQASLSSGNVLSADIETYGTTTPTELSGSASGEEHTLRTAGAILEFSAESSVYLENSDATTADNEGGFTIEFEVSAFGDDLYISNSISRGEVVGVDGLNYSIVTGGTATTSGAVVSSFSSTADEQDGYFVVQEGETQTFTLEVYYDPENSNSYRLQLHSINYNTVPSVPNKSQIFEPIEDFRTDYLTISS
jgi:hypothetical protein